MKYIIIMYYDFKERRISIALSYDISLLDTLLTKEIQM